MGCLVSAGQSTFWLFGNVCYNFWLVYGSIVSQKQIRSQVRDAAHAKIAELVAWSLDASATGVWPSQGFSGEAFPQRTYRYKLQGKELAKGWKNLLLN